MNVQGGEKKVMKKILSVALSTAMAFSMFASVAFGETANTPQAKFDALAAKGILAGYPDGQAHLEKDLTRAEFAKIITKLFDLPETVPSKLSYKDKNYTATMWATPYIEAVTAAKYMQGTDPVKGLFNFNGKVTVQEVAAVLVRALKLEEPTTTNNNAAVWAKGYVEAAINAGLIAKGTDAKATATRSLVVEAAYQVAELQTKPSVVSAEAQTPTSVLVTFSDKTTTNVTLTTALVEGVETTVPAFQYKGFTYSDVKVTLAAPKVVSVTTPNAKQLVVKFNREIASGKVIASDGTLVNGAIAVSALGTAPGVTIDDAKASLSSDKTELTLTLKGELSTAAYEFFKGQYTVTVTNAVTTTTGSAISAYTTLITVADTTAPTVVSATAAAKTTTNKITVKFSEPVISDRIIPIVNGVNATVAPGSSLDEVILTTGTLESGKSYNVSLLNVMDFAENTATPNPTTLSVAVTTDVAAPAITALNVTGELTAVVEFNKAIEVNSLRGNVKLLDANGVAFTGSITPSAVAGSTTKVKLTLSGFPTTGNTFNGTLVFDAAIRDVLGNTMGATTTRPVTFNLDKTAPTVASVTYVAGTGIQVKFSEEVALSLAPGDVVYVNEATGFSTTVDTATLNLATLSSDALTVTIPVTGLTGTYSLRLATGAVVDKAGTPNNNAVSVTSFTATATSTTDTTKPVISALAKGTATSTEQTITYTVTDAGGLNIPTIRDINNYTLGGKALPSGSYVTTNATTTNPSTVDVKVYIPSSAISSTDEQIFVVNGIKDVAGNTSIASKIGVILPDGVSPTLVSAAISSDDSTKLVLTFSEPVLKTAVVGNAFKFEVNGVRVPDGNKISIVPFASTGDYASKFYVSLNATSVNYNGAKALWFDTNLDTVVDFNEVVTYTTDDSGNINFNASYIYGVKVTVDTDADAIKDSSGNSLTEGTTVSAK